MGLTVQASNPGGGVRFSAPFQTGPEAHPTSYTMGTGSVPGVKRPERGVDHPPQSSAEAKESRAIPLLILRACVAYTKGENLT